MREPDNIEALITLAPDYMGFICYEPSPRYIDALPVAVTQALPAAIQKTGVFVNETAEVITGLITKYDFAAIQLHGNESPEFCALFKDKVIVLKAFGVDEQFDFELLKPYVNHVDFFLFDTKTDKHGGSGKTFDWRVLDKYSLNMPFFLSGGISLDNLSEIAKIEHPHLYGVDLNSRFETAPGVKNIEDLRTAFKIIKELGTHELRS